MINTTTEYKTAIKADTETITFQADFGFIPPNSVEGAVVSAAPEAIVSITSQLKDGATSMGGKWIYLEPNRVKLDGTYNFLTEDNTEQIGFVSSVLCDQSGAFETKPTITYTLDTTCDLIGVSAFFDDLGGEYATNVTVKYYNSSGTQINIKTVTNDQTALNIDLTQTGVKSFEIIINNWSVENARAKICQVLPGQMFLFTPDNTYSFEFTESINPFETNIKLPQYSITFDDSLGKFDIINPQGLSKFLRQRMKINASLKLLTSNGYEDVNVGQFYLNEWDLTTDDETVLKCSPLMAMASGVYVNPSLTGTQTVAQACAIIFSGLDVTYNIDTALSSVTVNKNIGEDVPLLNAMGQLAVACCGYWRFGRDGSYSLKQWQVPETTVDSITYDEQWSKPQISQTSYYTAVNVKYYVPIADIDNNISIKDYDCITSDATNDGETKDISSFFVPSQARAQTIGAQALLFYKQRIKQAVSFRGDMALQASDYISVTNDYGTSNGTITDNNFSWGDDGLDGDFKTLGGGNDE